MMAWRRWMAPLLIGAALGAVLTMLAGGHRDLGTLATVLLVVQVPVLTWDAWLTTRMLREERRRQEADELVRTLRAKGWWN